MVFGLVEINNARHNDVFLWRKNEFMYVYKYSLYNHKYINTSHGTLTLIDFVVFSSGCISNFIDST